MYSNKENHSIKMVNAFIDVAINKIVFFSFFL